MSDGGPTVKPQQLLVYTAHLVGDYESSDEAALNKRLNAFWEALCELAPKHGLRWVESQVTAFDRQASAIFECAHCTRLAINRDANPSKFDSREAHVLFGEVLADGGEFNGRLYCKLCLPAEHRWSEHT